MTVERISGGKLAMVVGRQEIEDPQDGGIDMDKAHELAKEAFSRCGVSPSKTAHMELEAFSGSGTVLIFASLTGSVSYCCAFRDFEALAQAADALDLWDLDSIMLIFIDNEYILIREGAFPENICEFTCQYQLEEQEKDLLLEHGKLLSRDFFTRTKELFRR